MRIVVIGGTGLIGSKLIPKLIEHGHDAVPASPASGVNSVTGEGLAEALKGANVVVDVSNSPSFEDQAVLNFFTASTRNLLDFAGAAGIQHYVALSVVGTERLQESGYFRAKLAQEKRIKESSLPYTIVHATQFFEFMETLANGSTVGDEVRLAPMLIQPMAAEDVAQAVGRVAAGSPLNDTVEVGGPEVFRLDEFIQAGLTALEDRRTVVADPHYRYFGALLSARTLIPEDDAARGTITFQDWIGDFAARRKAIAGRPS
jgi:uncharacterized protein YbjT (DUF2867 family)